MTNKTTLLLVSGVLALAGCSDDPADQPESQTTAASSSEPALPEPITADDAAGVDLSERLVTEVSFEQGPDWLVPSFGSLWVKRDSGGVTRIDPANGRVLAEIGPVGGRNTCQGIGASDGAIWACTGEGEIARIDPDTDSIVATVRIDKFPDQGRLVSAAGQIWVLTDAGNELTGIDTRTNKPSTRVALPGACVDLAVDGTTLWATCTLEDLLLRIDAEAGEVTGELELPGARNASAADHVWVGFDEGVAQVDPEALEVLAVYELFPQYNGSLFATTDAVWVREEDPGHFLSRIDPSEQRIVETIDAPKLPTGGDVVTIGDSLWATAFNDLKLVQLRTGD